MDVLLDLYRDLGIPLDYRQTTSLPFCAEIDLERLVVAQLDTGGRPLVVSVETADAWRAMMAKASADGVIIDPFSGFRSYRYQASLLKRHLKAGRAIEDVLRTLAAPGYSEHHTGEAVDITTPGDRPGEESFANTDAYRWLCVNGGGFGFRESFPEGNPQGFIFEPWHWRFVGGAG
jgi:D-alanyl-D-alanine carboxypeptidase